MTVTEDTGLQELWARKFHDTYERLAPQFGYETRPDTKAFDPDSPNGQLMIVVCAEVVGQALLAQRSETRAETFAEILKWLRGWRESDPPETMALETWRVLGQAKSMIAQELESYMAQYNRSGSYRPSPTDGEEK